jgi:catechol 2,3-dioxygenase-like lactoylglutathione lyase family enzyme
MAKSFDRGAEDIGNIVLLEHVNVRIPDQRLATLFYVTGLGLTRDPFLMTSDYNMWINVGRGQFHLPTGEPQVVRGRTGLVLPDRAALIDRLEKVAPKLKDTEFSFAPHNDYVDTTCPWGNRLRCHAPDARFGKTILGIPYVEFPVPEGTAKGIAKFYREIMGTNARTSREDGVEAAHAQVGHNQEIVYRETPGAIDTYDGHHVAIYVTDFSGPHKRLADRGLVFEESDQYQYRFKDIVDPKTGKVLFTLEHEVRSMTHPLYARPLVNRNPALTNAAYLPGYEDQAWAAGTA